MNKFLKSSLIVLSLLLSGCLSPIDDMTGEWKKGTEKNIHTIGLMYPYKYSEVQDYLEKSQLDYRFVWIGSKQKYICQVYIKDQSTLDKVRNDVVEDLKLNFD